MINHVNNWEKANKEQNNESITADLERYKERVKTFEQHLNIDLSSREKMIDSQMDDMIWEKLALKEQIDSLEQNLSKQIKEKESLFQTFLVFKNESKEKENKYMENEIDLEKKIKELDNIIFKVGQSAQTVHMLTKPQAFYDNTHKQALETLILEEESRSKMFEKAKDPEVIAKKISHKPIDYAQLNSLIDDFEKHFYPQQELSTEQAFWFHTLNPSIKPSYTPPVIMEVPCKLPKVSLVNASLKKLKFHLTQFDFVVNKSNTPSALEEGEWGFENTKAVFNNEIIPFLKSLKDIFNVFDKDLLNEITELQTVFDQMEASVQYQNAVAIPEYFEINDLKAWLLDKDTTICKLKDTIKSLRKNTKEENVNYDKCDFEPNNKELENSVANLLSENEPQIQDKVFVIASLKNDLRKLKRKEIVENVVHIPSATTISPGIFKIDLEPLPPRLLQNKEVHIDYLRNTQEQANIILGDNSCLNAITPNSRKVAITPMNNAKKVRIDVFTTTNVVPPKETTSHSDEIQKLEIKVYSKKPKNVKNIGSSKIAKIVESKKANHSEPNQSWGSNATDIPSSSSLVMPGTIRFGNDQIARIMGYGDFQLGNVDISRGRDTNLYTFSLDDMLKSSPICLLSKASKTKSWLWHRWLSHLNFGTLKKLAKDLNKLAKDGLARGIPRLKFQKDHLCSACALGKSKKTSHQHMDLCGPMRVASINGKSSGPELHYMTPATPSTGLMSNPVSQQPCIPPIRDVWDRLFQPMFNEYFNPPPIAVSPVQEAPAPRAEVVADSPVSTSIDQDAPSTSIPTLQEQENSLIISQGFEESPKTPTFHVDPLNESPNKDSTSHGSSSNVRQIHTTLEHIGRWTKDHLIENVISDSSRSVSTRKQLHTDAMWCYFDAFLTSVEPKNFKQAMTKSSWIDAMQEEIHEFERLEV
ncbi:retrovirus-related pol polyprotein from transposon TNT 1-94 [Tanacetum coccineum]